MTRMMAASFLARTVALGFLVSSAPALAAPLPDPDAAKAADRCQKAIAKSGAKFAAMTLKSLESCCDAFFTCVQTKPGEQKCLDKALARCGKGGRRDGPCGTGLIQGNFSCVFAAAG